MTSPKSRQFKINKWFAPPPVDEGDEFYANGIFHFNVTKILAFISANQKKFPIECVDVVGLAKYGPEGLNEETIKTADLSNPIILAEIAPSRFNVIDGNHRLEKARREGLKSISAHRVMAEDHLNFLKSVQAYEAYIKYWNSKIRAM